MKCDMCKEVLTQDEVFEYYGKKLCEDCYIAVLHRPKTCDPAAVASAVNARRQLGQTGTEGMTDLQKRLYEYVKEKGKVSREELAQIFNLTPMDMEKQIAIMRHCELLKGLKEQDKIYITTF